MDPKTIQLRSPTLARKILVRVLPIVVLSLFLVGLLNYFVAEVQISGYIDKEVEMLADQVAASTRTFLEQRNRDLETLAESPLLVDYYVNVEYGLHPEARMAQEGMEQYFKQFSQRTDTYDMVAFYNATGEPVAAVAGTQVLIKRDGERLDAPLPIGWAELVRSETYRSPILTQGEQPQMVIARSVRDDEKQLRGLLVLVCNLTHLADILHRSQVGIGGRAYIESAAGEPLLGDRPSGSADRQSKVPLPGTSWEVVMEADSEEFIGPLVHLRNLTLLLSFLVALLVSVTLMTAIRWAMRPLAEVTEGTRRLAQGELDHRLPIPEVRDLKPLVISFNEMAGKLKERNEELQARIRQLNALRLMENTVMQRMSEESILRTCLRAVADGLGFDRVGLYWIDRNSSAILGRYVHNNTFHGFSEAAFRQRTVPLGDADVLNRVIASRQPLLVKRPAAEAGVDPTYVRETGTKEFVMAPLCGKEEVFGVIVADNAATGRPLAEDHRDGLLLFASAAGLAMENATLIDRITDSETRHRMVLDNSPVAILGISRNQHIRTWNRGAESIFGYSLKEVLGQPLRTLIATEAWPQYQTLTEKLMQQGAVHDFQIEGRASDGKQLMLSVSWGGRDTDNVLANEEWTVVISDVTQSRKLQEQLIVSEKLSAVGQLIAGVAHELNNPLQAVVGYADLMLEHGSKDAPRDELRHISENATRCRKIVDNLLLFVRHGDVVRGPVSIQKAIEAVLKLLHHKFLRSPRIEVVTDLPGEPVHVLGNFQQLEQVLINLINNACDVLETWDGRKEICIRARVDGDRVHVEVIDSGPGVPDQARDQLFEPFFTTKREGRGTGLGLPLCRQIIEDHGGTLDLGPGKKGATFHFELPVLVSVPEAPEVEPAQSESVQSQHVLLLEDDPSVRSLLHDVLKAEGHDVHVSENVQQARGHSNARNFDIVVTDVHLPDGTGLDFFQTWSRHSARPRPRFLFLTGDIVTEEIEQLCQQSGARVLQKPVNLREFRRVLRALLVSEHLDASV